MINTFVFLNAVLSLIYLGGLLWSVFSLFIGMGGAYEEQMATLPSAEERSMFMPVIYSFAGYSILSSLLVALTSLMAAIGLHKRTKWGYYCHLTTAALVTFTYCCCCIGIVYAIPAFIFALKPEFKGEFPELADK